MNTIYMHPDQTSIFWDHVISRVLFHGRKRGGTGKEDGLTFVKDLKHWSILVAGSFAGIEM